MSFRAVGEQVARAGSVTRSNQQLSQPLGPVRSLFITVKCSRRQRVPSTTSIQTHFRLGTENPSPLFRTDLPRVQPYKHPHTQCHGMASPQRSEARISSPEPRHALHITIIPPPPEPLSLALLRCALAYHQSLPEIDWSLLRKID